MEANHVHIFNTGNHLHGATADTAGLDRAAFGSMLNTRLKRCAQVIDARRSAGDGRSSTTLAGSITLGDTILITEAKVV